MRWSLELFHLILLLECAPSCSGLGVKMEFDPDLVIPDKTKSILDGAIVPWNGRFASYRRQSLRSVGKKFGFDLMMPISKMSSKQIDANATIPWN